MPFIFSAVTAIAGAISGVLAAGGIGAALVRLGGTLLLSYASQALMPKPKVSLQARTVTVREPVVPRDMVYGRARKGGRPASPPAARCATPGAPRAASYTKRWDTALLSGVGPRQKLRDQPVDLGPNFL